MDLITLKVKTDMRDEKGLQTSPSYPTIGFSVFAGKGNHVLLEPSHQPEALFACEMKASDGVCLEVRATGEMLNPVLTQTITLTLPLMTTAVTLSVSVNLSLTIGSASLETRVLGRHSL